MSYVLRPSKSVRKEVRRVATEQLDDAVERLDALLGHGSSGARPDTATSDDLDIEGEVHEVRKRCKETRGLARLVRPKLGNGFRPFDRLVRDAARELSSMRDAHALLGTLDELITGSSTSDRFTAAHDRQVELARDASAGIESNDPRLTAARDLLTEARETAASWEIGKRFDAVADGLTDAYESAGKRAAEAEQRPTDERVHEWRKSVKYLWYHVRLLGSSAPSVLEPLEAALHDLSDALGDDHDLAVLIAQVESDPEHFGGDDRVAELVGIARDEQDELRRRAFRTAATLFAESPKAFVRRIGRYHEVARQCGPERETGGLDVLGEDRADDDDESSNGHEASNDSVERERKWLIDELPPDLRGGRADGGVVEPGEETESTIRQGYLAIDGEVSARVREDSRRGCTFTAKGGSGTARLELEWSIGRDQFEAAWAHTAGRRVEKTRYRLALGDRTIELDVFAGDLAGLIVAEIEFDSDDELAAFVAPDWFGPDVSDDLRYTNAALAVSQAIPTRDVTQTLIRPEL